MNRFANIIIAVLLFSVVSCARKISFTNSIVVPAAQGYVKIKMDNNHNYHIEVSLRDLAPPERLQPARHIYVVWMETSREAVKNIGQVNSSAGLISKRLKASFETVSPVKPIKIFITAEDEASAQYPGALIILSTENF